MIQKELDAFRDSSSMKSALFVGLAAGPVHCSQGVDARGGPWIEGGF